MTAVRIEWPAELNEQGRPMRWFGSWLVGDAGEEGAWFYSGTGGELGEYRPPAAATGIRIRRWPSDGLDAEYADILSLAVRQICAGELPFDLRQRYSLLPEDFQ